MIRSVCKFFFLILVIFCASQPLYGAEKVTVFVSIAPQKYFVQKIAGDFVKVHVMVPPGESPMRYKPDSSQMALLSKASLYFAMGVPFEDIYLEKMVEANPDMTIIYMDKNIRKVPIIPTANDQNVVDKTEGGLQFGENRLDPHIWLSPPLVISQIRLIMDALQTVDPVNRVVYQSRGGQFLIELINLHKEIVQILSGKQEFKFMDFHPAWGYFAKTYKLNQVPVDIKSKDFSSVGVQKSIDRAVKEKIKIVLIEPNFPAKLADSVARQINGEVIVADPLAENWIENLRQLAKKLKKTLI